MWYWGGAVEDFYLNLKKTTFLIVKNDWVFNIMTKYLSVSLKKFPLASLFIRRVDKFPVQDALAKPLLSHSGRQVSSRIGIREAFRDQVHQFRGPWSKVVRAQIKVSELYSRFISNWSRNSLSSPWIRVCFFLTLRIRSLYFKKTNYERKFYIREVSNFKKVR